MSSGENFLDEKTALIRTEERETHAVLSPISLRSETTKFAPLRVAQDQGSRDCFSSSLQLQSEGDSRSCHRYDLLEILIFCLAVHQSHCTSAQEVASIPNMVIKTEDAANDSKMTQNTQKK